MLTLVRFDIERVNTIREIDAPTKGVTIINCFLGAKLLVRTPPLHWRAGRWDKPPVDVEVDPINGRLRALQIVLQDEFIRQESLPEVEAETMRGIPVFAVGVWSPDNRYFDEHLDAQVAWSTPRDLYIGFGTPSPIALRRGEVDDRFAILLDREGRVVGIEIRHITESETEAIRNAEPV